MDKLYEQQSKLSDLVKGYVSLSSTMHFLALFLVVMFLVDILVTVFPFTSSLFLVRKFRNVTHLIKILFFFVIFFLHDSAAENERTSQQKFTLAIFSILVILTLLYIAFYVLGSIYMFIKYHSLQIALAGIKVLIVDGKCFTVDCYNPAPVFTKQVLNGLTEFRFGEHCLSGPPTSVAYRSVFYAVDYKFFNSFIHDNLKVIIFNPETTTKNQII